MREPLGRRGRRDALLDEGEVDEALRLARRLALRHPGDPDAAIFLCATLLKAGRPEEALAGAERARLSELDDSYGAQFLCGQLGMALNRPSEAIPFLRRSVRLQPEAIEAVVIYHGRPSRWIFRCEAALEHVRHIGTHVSICAQLSRLASFPAVAGVMSPLFPERPGSIRKILKTSRGVPGRLDTPE